METVEKRLVVRFGKDYVNIRCDSIFQDQHFLYGYLDGDLVAVFMVGTFESAYLNEKG